MENTDTRIENQPRESGRAGERESGRAGERESGRAGDRESGRAGERESGRAGERESGRAGERENRSFSISLAPSLPRSPALPLSASVYTNVLEANPQTEFNLSRITKLTVDETESRGTVNIHRRVVGLKMVQHVGELRGEGHAKPLGELDFFRDAEVEVPTGQAADRPGCATPVVKTQDQTTELRVDLIRVGEHVHAGSPIVRRVGVQAHRPIQREVLMGCVAASVRLRKHSVLPTGSRTAVHLAERLAVGGEGYAQRQPALGGEERRD